MRLEFEISGRNGVNERSVESGQDFDAIAGYSERVFKLSGPFSVFCDRSPAVVEDFDSPVALVDHGFDGERHTFDEADAVTFAAVVWDLEILVELSSDAVTDVIANDGESAPLGEFLNGCADIAHTGAGFYLSNADFETFSRRFDEVNGFFGGRTDVERRGNVAVPAIEDGGDIDIDDIAVFEDCFFVRNAVADDLVDRNA